MKKKKTDYNTQRSASCSNLNLEKFEFMCLCFQESEMVKKLKKENVAEQAEKQV